LATLARILAVVVVVVVFTTTTTTGGGGDVGSSTLSTLTYFGLDTRKDAAVADVAQNPHFMFCDAPRFMES
jgi:hypothetical protein